MNYDFKDSNVGFKDHHIPKIDMRKFDGKDMITCISHREKYFDLQDVQPSQKVRISSFYIEPNQFVWYRWISSCKPLVIWSIFRKEIKAHYEDTKRNTFHGQLINLKQKGLMVEHIQDFKNFNIRAQQ